MDGHESLPGGQRRGQVLPPSAATATATATADVAAATAVVVSYADPL